MSHAVINYILPYLQIFELMRNSVTYFSPSEYEAVVKKLLNGEISTTLTKYGVKWEAIKCKDSPEYLQSMTKHGIFSAMFSSSPSMLAQCALLQCTNAAAVTGAIVPRLYHTPALIPSRVEEFGQTINAWPNKDSVRLVADRQEYSETCRLQGMRGRNCVPPIGFP